MRRLLLHGNEFLIPLFHYDVRRRAPSRRLSKIVFEDLTSNLTQIYLPLRVYEMNDIKTADQSQTSTYWRWFFEDRDTGKIVIAQTPNLPLIIFGIAWVMEALLHVTGMIGLAVFIVKVASLTIWAFDEIVRGVNPWRRCLGACAIILELFMWLR